MRGYFGIGAEEISKPINLGALMRTANAFGASFFFTINARAESARSLQCRYVAQLRACAVLSVWERRGDAAAEGLRAGWR